MVGLVGLESVPHPIVYTVTLVAHALTRKQAVLLPPTNRRSQSTCPSGEVVDVVLLIQLEN
jgi:hypothetical protein